MENIKVEEVKRARGRPKKTDEDKTWNKERMREYHLKYYHEHVKKTDNDEKRLQILLKRMNKKVVDE